MLNISAHNHTNDFVYVDANNTVVWNRTLPFSLIADVHTSKLCVDANRNRHIVVSRKNGLNSKEISNFIR